MIEKIFTHIIGVRKKWLRKESYNVQIIKSEKVRIWYDHFKKTGERLNFKTIKVDTERIKHLLR